MDDMRSSLAGFSAAHMSDGEVVVTITLDGQEFTLPFEDFCMLIDTANGIIRDVQHIMKTQHRAKP